MKPFTILACLVAAAAAGCANPAARSDSIREGRAVDVVRPRVGTFDRTRLLVAYYGSTVHGRQLQALMAEHEEARAAGDARRMSELEAQGAAAQDLAHRQLAGEAPLANVLAHLAAQWPAIAAATKVDVIVEQPHWSSSKVELIDVTSELTARFPSAKE